MTDFASVPRALRASFSLRSLYSDAAVLHDFLYWTQACTKAQADNLFLIAMQETGVAAPEREAFYLAVRFVGGWHGQAMPASEPTVSFASFRRRIKSHPRMPHGRTIALNSIKEALGLTRHIGLCPRLSACLAMTLTCRVPVCSLEQV